MENESANDRPLLAENNGDEEAAEKKMRPLPKVASEEDKERTYKQYEGIKKEQAGSLNGLLALAAFGISLGLSLPHGFNTGVLNPQEQRIKAFLNGSLEARLGRLPSDGALQLFWSLAVSIYLVGGMIGALSFGAVADRLGRKRATFVFTAAVIAGSVPFAFCQLANSLELLLLGRLIVGYGCGASSGLSPLFLTEIAPVNIRGGMGVLHQLMLTVGILISQLLGLDYIMGSDELWPYLCALSCAPCLLCLLIVPFVPDSPRFLVVQRNDEAAASDALMRYRRTRKVSAAMLELKMDRRRAELQPAWSIAKILRKGSFRMPLLLVVGANVAQQLSGINVAFYYSNGILRQTGIPEGSIQYAVLGIGAINVAMTGVSVLLVEKFGRKPLLLASHVGMFVAACALTLGLNLLQFPSLDWMAYVAAGAMVSFVVFFAIGLGCIPQFLGSELFLTGPRPAAMALAAFGNWLGNWMVGLLFPFTASLLGNWCFAPFLVFLAASFVFLLTQLPETKGCTPEEMASRFGTDSGMPKVNSRSSNMMELIADHIVGQDDSPHHRVYSPKDLQDYIDSQSNVRGCTV